jgi:hypothetical protein
MRRSQKFIITHFSAYPFWYNLLVQKVGKRLDQKVVLKYIYIY